jgi:hypothetical protein
MFCLATYGYVVANITSPWFNMRYSDGATALLGSYLSDRTCYRSDGEYSTVKGIEYGVPQGSVLVQLLFISFIDDVSGVINFCRFHIYADDLQSCRFTRVSLLQTFRDFLIRLMRT